MIPSGVELHWFDVAAAVEPLLTPAEQERAGRMRSVAARRRFIARRSLTRRLLADRVGVEPAALELTVGAHGKPALAGDTSVRFNVSSTVDVVVVAVADGRDLGVDVERVRTNVRHHAVARRFFTAREQAAIGGVEDFFTIWTLKEAVVKATGRGISHLPLGSFEVDPRAGGGASALAACPSEPELVDAWCLAPIDAPGGLKAALAVAQP